KHRRVIDARAWQEIEAAEWAMSRWRGESRILLGHLRRIYIDALEVPVEAWEAADRFAQLRGRAPKRRSSEEEWGGSVPTSRSAPGRSPGSPRSPRTLSTSGGGATPASPPRRGPSPAGRHGDSATWSTGCAPPAGGRPVSSPQPLTWPSWTVAR